MDYKKLTAQKHALKRSNVFIVKKVTPNLFILKFIKPNVYWDVQIRPRLNQIQAWLLRKGLFHCASFPFNNTPLSVLHQNIVLTTLIFYGNIPTITSKGRAGGYYKCIEQSGRVTGPGSGARRFVIASYQSLLPRSSSIPWHLA